MLMRIAVCGLLLFAMVSTASAQTGDVGCSYTIGSRGDVGIVIRF